jgi:hypothetical protein
MNEGEWLASTDPQLMLAFLCDSGRLSERKARLFSVAVCRRLWPLLTDERSRQAVEVAERFADNQATSEELSVAAEEARHAVSEPAGAAFAAWATAGGFTTAAAAAAWAAREAAEAAAGIPHTPTDSDPWQLTHPQEFAKKEGAWRAERCQQAALLRCIAGNPVRPVGMKGSWRASHLIALATGIYEERRWQDMPVFADALEEADCRDGVILAHCRGPGSHARGCFVVDLLLGKE